MYNKIFLKKEKLKNSPHPWFFSGALNKVYDDYGIGSIVDLYYKEEFISRGYYNNKTNIAYRVLTYNENEDINTEFFVKRFKKSQKLVETVVDLSKTNAYRLVFGENSYIPGLVIDRYDDIFVIQLHTAGVENLKDVIKDAIIELFSPKAIINKSDIQARRIEGLLPMEEVLYGKIDDSKIIKENDILFEIDFTNSQKTGTFLDQRENRLLVKKLFKKGRLLNMFGYNGGFNLYLKDNENCESINLDVSEKALVQYQKNLKLNKMNEDKHSFLKGDIFKMVGDDYKFDEEFDAIILDPPALAKNLKNKKRAVQQYINLNKFALRNLKEGGLLFSASCTSIVKQEDFEFAIYQAALRENCQISILEKRFNSTDHPMNPFFPEGIYLKFYVIYKY
jgi:23S rRNA (cytosine1962-C5)-methyltransferase